MFDRTPDGEIPFFNAIRCASAVYQGKIIAADRDLVGMCLYATQKQRNQFDFPNIYIFHDLDVPDAVRIRELEALLEDMDEFASQVGHYPDKDKPPFPLNEALWTAQHLFNHIPKNVGYKRIFIFSNDDNPPKSNGSERIKCIQRAKDLLEAGITIELFAHRQSRKPTDAQHTADHKHGATTSSKVSSIGPPTSYSPPSLAGSSSFGKPGSDQLKPSPNSSTSNKVTSYSNSGSGKLGAMSGSSHNSPFMSSDSSGSGDSKYMPFVVSTFWQHLLYSPDDDYNGSVNFYSAERFRQLELMSRKRLFRKRSVGALSMVLAPDTDGNGLELAIQLYNPIMRTSKNKFKWLDPDTNRPLKTETRLICQTTASELLDGDLEYYYTYGGENIYIGKDELKEIRTLAKGPGLKILGFKPITRLKKYHSMTHSSFVYPNDGSVQGSSKLFWALHQKMLESNKLAIGLLVPRQNASPVYVALIPQKEVMDDNGSQVEPPGMVIVPLPYADDIRDLSLPVVQPAPDAAIQKAKKLVARLTVDFDPNDFENPSLQKHYSCLHAMALERETVEVKPDLTEPDLVGMAYHKGAILDFKSSVFEEHYDPSKRRKAEAAEERPTGLKKVKTEVDLSQFDFPTLVAQNKLDSLNLAQLKEYCRSHMLRTTGKKSELIERINDYVSRKGDVPIKQSPPT
eukprot:NODE_987_length_2202_cov_40.947571_g843_i0.p1 GENE.NODE_987_length_2202_cov_40.947571_g843_i0~~NODE_987_length_2202_cov_40.947571_g843_i0.p1  ORF type:complete len:731 (-),score=149.25 NODE_987_length_2202_cov_40.947571_g843_i0:9-2057(-)